MPAGKKRNPVMEKPGHFVYSGNHHFFELVTIINLDLTNEGTQIFQVLIKHFTVLNPILAVSVISLVVFFS